MSIGEQGRQGMMESNGPRKRAKYGEKGRSEPHQVLLKFERTETVVCVEGTGYF